jgi:transcriptional regulator with XRE-family HTH domain
VDERRDHPYHVCNEDPDDDADNEQTMGKGNNIENVATEAEGSERESVHINKSFGEIVRRLRRKSGMTLDQLAVASRVSRAMLSSVERGEKSPTLSVLAGIANGLNVTMSHLMGEETPPTLASVTPRRQRLIFHDEETGIERHLLSPTHLDTGIELVEHVLPKGQVFDGTPHPGTRTDKYVVVSEGKLTIEMENVVYTLDEADSMYFQIRGDYRFVNNSQRLCRYYLFIVHRQK